MKQLHHCDRCKRHVRGATPRTRVSGRARMYCRACLKTIENKAPTSSVTKATK